MASAYTPKYMTPSGVQFLRFNKNGETIYKDAESRDCFNLSSAAGRKASTTYIQTAIQKDKPEYAVGLYYNKRGEKVREILYDHGVKAIFDANQYPKFLRRYFEKPQPKGPQRKHS